MLLYQFYIEFTIYVALKNHVLSCLTPFSLFNNAIWCLRKTQFVNKIYRGVKEDNTNNYDNENTIINYEKKKYLSVV